MDNYFGYSDQFLGKDRLIQLPQLTSTQRADLAPVSGTTDNIARYANYSVALSRSRGFPFFTASNIDGILFKKAGRVDRWRKDTRIAPDLQWGSELYKASKSDFDKGHMVKREDVQWGNTQLDATQAANSTFFYTNAVPQHANLNRKIWANLEDYILHDESVEEQLRIAVFAGPVMTTTDPEFVSLVRKKVIRLPILFWKVVVFAKADGSLCRVGFLMGQKALLRTNGIIKPQPIEREFSPQTELFSRFEEADTYQVNLETIESLTGLTLPPARDLYQDHRPIRLIIDAVDVAARDFSPIPNPNTLGFRIPNLVL